MCGLTYSLYHHRGFISKELFNFYYTEDWANLKSHRGCWSKPTDMTITCNWLWITSTHLFKIIYSKKYIWICDFFFSTLAVHTSFTRGRIHSLKTRTFWLWSVCIFLTLKVLNFWKCTSYCSLKPLWSGMGEVVPARTSPTLHTPSPPTVHQLSWLAL